MDEPNRQLAQVRWLSRSLEDTDRLAQAVAVALPDQATIALIGTLGAGKTCFVQGLAAALGVPREEVVSPTFVLCHEYHGRRTISHYDLYRLTKPQEFWNLGPEEAFESHGLVVIEWADRFPQCLPAEYLEITIEAIDEFTRAFNIRAQGAKFDRVLVGIRE